MSPSDAEAVLQQIACYGGFVPHLGRCCKLPRMTGLGWVTTVAGALSPDLVVAQPAKAFSLPRSITPSSGVSDRFDSGRTCLICGTINFWQASEKACLFECVSIWVKGGWKETWGVRRPISGQRPVSENRIASLNPFEKRKKTRNGASSRVCEWLVAEGTGLVSNLLFHYLPRGIPAYIQRHQLLGSMQLG